MRKAKVFLSCGQRDENERGIAQKVEKIIREEFEMDCYNADSVHGFDDVMSITKHLSMTDYYLFIDVRRKNGIPVSIFAHQEFALARAWGLDEMLVFQEEGLDSEGMLKYVLAHPIKFTQDTLYNKVRCEIKKWDKHYSRNLVVNEIVPSTGLIPYRDQTGQSLERVWFLHIENRRKDRAAIHAVAFLDSIVRQSDRIRVPVHDRSYLKWAGHWEAYENAILPGETATVDALSLRVGEPGVFLHSRADVAPRKPILTEPGEHLFQYRIWSDGFPPLEVSVKVDYRGQLTLAQNLVDPGTIASLDNDTQSNIVASRRHEPVD